MKKKAALFCLVIVCLSSTFNFAQSRRVQPSSDPNSKANQRQPKSADSPTPAPTPAVEENQPAETVIEDSEVLKIDTELVTIPFKVVDRQGKFVGGLTKENFQVSEDQVEQEIAYFTNEEQPFTVALVLDMSYSAKFKIAEIQSAAAGFIAQLRPNDKVMVVSFDEEVHLLCNPTNDRKVLQTAIRSTKIASGTSLYEAIDLVINSKFKRLAGRKAIVLFTDGVDTTSRKANDLGNLSDALELDTLVFPIQYDTFADVQAMKNKPISLPPTQPGSIPSQSKNPFPFPVPNAPNGTAGSEGTSAEDYKRADEYLSGMADRTGGRVYKADSTANLALAFSNIAGELRQFYSLGYYPKEKAKTGRKRRIKVRVNKQNLVVRARDGYIVARKGEK